MEEEDEREMARVEEALSLCQLREADFAYAVRDAVGLSGSGGGSLDWTVDGGRGGGFGMEEVGGRGGGRFTVGRRASERSERQRQRAKRAQGERAKRASESVW